MYQNPMNQNSLKADRSKLLMHQTDQKTIQTQPTPL
jgi:hypothetical protein